MHKPTLIKPNQLRLRDVVRLHCPHNEPGDIGPFTASVVIRVEADRVKFFRPYAITSEMATMSGVIPYTGAEIYEILTDDTRLEYELLERPPAAR